MFTKMLAATVAALAMAALPGMGNASDDAPYRIVKDPLELTIHMHFRNRYVYDENWPVAQEATRLTGIKLKNVASLATTNSNEAFNLLMASGNLPDIVGGSEVERSLKDEFNRYGMEGAFIPLDDLIDKYAPNIKKFFDEHPILRKAISGPDKKLYYIPYLPDGKYARGWHIRQDWLDKLGLKTPETVDELHAVLEAFRDRDPNGNGKQDEVPLFMREDQELMRLLVFWGGRSSGSDIPNDFYVEDGKVMHGYAQPSYRVGMRNIAKWYAEGLLDKEHYTRKGKARDFLLGNDLGGVTHDWFASTGSYNDSLKDKIPGFHIVAFPPVANVDGKRIEENRRIPVKPSGWAITSVNEHPEETIKYFDFFFTELGKRLSNFGVEGVHYDLVDGKAIYKPEILNAKRPVNAQMYDIGAQIPIGFPQDYAYEVQWTNKYALEGIALYDKGDYLIDQFLGVSMTPKERDVFDQYWPSILAFMLEMQQAWVLGSRNVDDDWDSYMGRLEKLNYPKVVEVMQTAYDRQYK